MQITTIKKMSRLYYLTPQQQGLEPVLNRLIHNVIDEHLDCALATQESNSEEEICVQLLHIPLRFYSEQSHYKTSVHWSQLIAQTLEQTLQAGGANVVRYRSRLHALLDFVMQVSDQCVQRAWAWNQLGWSNLPDNPSLIQARQQLLLALHQQSFLLVTVFIELARVNRLQSFLLDISQRDGIDLFNAIFSNASMPQHWITCSWQTVENKQYTLAAVLISESMIAQSLLRTASAITQSIPSHYWLLLILIELEPAVFKRGDHIVSGYLAAIKMQLQGTNAAVLLLDSHNNLMPTINKNTQGVAVKKLSDYQEQLIVDKQNTQENLTSLQSQQVSSKTLLVPSELPPLQDDASQELLQKTAQSVPQNLQQKWNSKGGDSVTNHIQHELDTNNRVALSEQQKLHDDLQQQAMLNHITTATTTTNEDDQHLSSDYSDASSVQTITPLPEDSDWFAIDNYSSQWGGLFYLLPLLNGHIDSDKDSIIIALANANALNQRSISWILYHFFTILFCKSHLIKTGIDFNDDDPVLRLLCTLPLQGELPEYQAPLPEEITLIDTQVQRLIDRVQTLFASDDLSQASLWSWLCCRTVTLRVDVAWVEVVFLLDALDTSIRRAGLDLHPEYVSWMAKVVKLRYE